MWPRSIQYTLAGHGLKTRALYKIPKEISCASWYYYSIHPSIYGAAAPFPGLGLLHKTPPFISIRSSSPPSSCPQQL